MAVRWLDAARYGDTNGYSTDGVRNMWRWRDWVIDAFNRNMPFDQFTIEQIAGDMMPNATRDQLIATAFNRNHRTNAESGIIDEEFRVEYVADRVETTSTVWLGLTVGCARCHDHKFDPITQKDYYRLFAYFNNVPERGLVFEFGNDEPYIKAPTPEQEARLNELDRKIAAAARKYATFQGNLARAPTVLGEVGAPTLRRPIGRFKTDSFCIFRWMRISGKRPGSMIEISPPANTLRKTIRKRKAGRIRKCLPGQTCRENRPLS